VVFYMKKQVDCNWLCELECGWWEDGGWTGLPRNGEKVVGQVAAKRRPQDQVVVGRVRRVAAVGGGWDRRETATLNPRWCLAERPRRREAVGWVAMVPPRSGGSMALGGGLGSPRSGDREVVGLGETSRRRLSDERNGTCFLRKRGP
jgi:hypothetical protein